MSGRAAFCLISLFALSICDAATLNSDGSASNTQTQINAAINGDTILLPSSGSFTWSTGVSIPSTKWVILDGNGRTVTITGSGGISIDPHSTGNSRVTNFAFNANTDNCFAFNDTATSAAYRFDHCTIVNNTSTLQALININGRGRGLIDHITITSLIASKEFIHIWGWGADNTTGWTTNTGASLQGSSGLTYIEDCSFTTTAGQSNTSWIQGYYGCRVAFRHNTLNYVSIDMHGTGGNVGARWWEIYENTFTNSTGANQGFPINMRAGSGVIFNNNGTGMVESGSIGLCEEDSGWPADYQIGRGLNQTSDPAYVWGNSISLAVDDGDAPETDGMVQLNRDVFASVKPGYTQYTYPHPLQAGGGGDTTAPTITTAKIGSNGSTITLTANESVAIGSGGSGGLTLSMSGGAVTATYSSGLTWNLSRILDLRESGTYSYTQPGNGIEDLAGNDLASFTGVSVTNGISASRVVTWDPGVPGGITNRTTIFTTVSPPSPPADAQPSIQAAINACPVGQVVLIPSGTYRLLSQISLTKGITLRGAGTTQTILNSEANWHAIQVGNFPSAPVATSVSGNPVKGATQITVASVTTPSISIGDYIVIDQINDGVNVINVDDQSRDGGTRLLSQILKVTNISATTLTFTPALNTSFTAAQTPEVWELNQGTTITSGAGVEDLTVTRIAPLNAFSYSNFKFVCTVNSWVKNVTSNVPDFWHVDLDRSAWNTIEHCYFNDGNNHGTGGQAYGVVAGNRSCYNLTQNNVFRRLRHGMVLKEGATGNVFSYNYSFDSYQADGWLATDMNPHGGHSYMNLFEGNCAVKAYADWTHGSSANNTYFRNWITRVSSLQAGTNSRRVVDLEINQNGYNFIGNVLGSQSQTWTAEETGATRTSGGEYVWSFGFFSDGDNTQDSTVPLSTIFRTGNFSARTNTTTWDTTAINQVLPSSLYLSAKPSWFGSLSWPPYGPSTGTIEAAVDIPAGYRYINGSDPPGGDVTPPSVATAVINTAGTRFILTANENVATGVGGSGGMSISASGGAVTLTFNLAESSGATLAYSTSRVIGVGETITRTYVQPGSGIEDSSGNDLSSFTAQPVTNSSAADITAPTPSPSTFSAAPAAAGPTSISMTATTAVDAGGAVQYSFDETTGNTGGTDSGWQSSSTYTDTGLNPGTQYAYRVQARDPSANTTTFSASLSATTQSIAGARSAGPGREQRSNIVNP